jgi:hypothetical protein
LLLNTSNRAFFWIRQKSSFDTTPVRYRTFVMSPPLAFLNGGFVPDDAPNVGGGDGDDDDEEEDEKGEAKQAARYLEGSWDGSDPEMRTTKSPKGRICHIS